jgi:hypothetical protein
LIAAVVEEKRLVARIWHPDPPHGLHHLNQGIHAEVLQGSPAYQVTSGEKIDL